MRLPLTGQLGSTAFEGLLVASQPCIAGTDQTVDLDLSSAEWGSPSGMVPVTGLLRFLSSRGVRINVVAYPADEAVCAYLQRMNFFRWVGAEDQCEGTRRLSGEGRFIEITELHQAEIAADSKKKLMRLLQNLPEGAEATDASRLSFIDACGELVANTRHAYDASILRVEEDRPAALLQAQFYPKNGVVEFCICDCGIGVKRSMEGEHAGQFPSHLDAIDAALAFRNRNMSGGGAGLGLSALQSYIKRNGGTLRIRSGDALKMQRGSRGVTCTQHMQHWEGTVVTLTIKVDKAADLSKIWHRLSK
jgi:hypothetical protein